MIIYIRYQLKLTEQLISKIGWALSKKAKNNQVLQHIVSAILSLQKCSESRYKAGISVMSLDRKFEDNKYKTQM